MVTGGFNGDDLDSTELLRPGSDWQVITSARLPRPLEGVSVSTVNNRVFLFGEWRQIQMNCYTFLTLTCVTEGMYSNEDHSADILEYRHDDGWKKVETLQKARNNHGTSIVDFEDFADYCNCN